MRLVRQDCKETEAHKETQEALVLLDSLVLQEDLERKDLREPRDLKETSEHLVNKVLKELPVCQVSKVILDSQELLDSQADQDQLDL